MVIVMRKVLVLFFLILVVSGCDNDKNKYENFEHYDLKNFRIINSNTFYSDKGSEIYVVADMSPEQAEGRENGIFYQINPNDYILLDIINVSDYYEHLENNDSYTYFYDNKKKGEKQLFIIRNLGSIRLKYNLNGENYEKITLNFDMTEISSEPLDAEAGDENSALYCRKKLLEIPDMLKEVLEGTDALAFRIHDKPELELPEEYKKAVELLKDSVNFT